MIKKIVSEAIEKNQKQYQEIKNNLDEKELVHFNIGGGGNPVWS